ncbi:putative paraquat-inducible protein A [Peribacillus sp. B2I2]
MELTDYYCKKCGLVVRLPDNQHDNLICAKCYKHVITTRKPAGNGIPKTIQLYLFYLPTSLIFHSVINFF